ncbi:hypothetical protein AMAG_06520 [Allomyces macrogynus ATCC 38327]|uniref:CID domain-containing protein n=1 Tax=Allomyces macrogynus (strain ATCC 38327) TaxID=578462 RepID=A0A0L0SGS7_ALLM3|nr:hypothetical protein AMAG_06520 [Allomyces macrogynus ATCC 38327]|eukprot:KNE61718.1 hypothetical protein AMAG_06520 [Allomyces macrogynus ATCC 38327]
MSASTAPPPSSIAGMTAAPTAPLPPSQLPKPMVDYDRDLRAVLDSRPPISASRVQSLTKAALKHATSPDLAATVAYLVARFVRKCPPGFKLSGLYLVDSICRASFAQFKDKDLYVRQFLGLLPGLTPEIAKGPDKDRERIKKLLDVWRASKVFPPEFLDKAHAKWVLRVPSSSSALASPTMHHASSPHVGNGHALAPVSVSVPVPVPGTAPPTVPVSGPPAPPLIDPSALLQSLTTALNFGITNNTTSSTATPPPPMFTSSAAAAPPTIVLPSMPLPAAPAPEVTADPANPLAAIARVANGQRRAPGTGTGAGADRVVAAPAATAYAAPAAAGRGGRDAAQQQGMPGGLVPPPLPVGDGAPPATDASGLVGEWVQVEGGCGPNEIKVLSRTLYIGGVTHEVTKETLQELFSPFGHLDSVMVNPARGHAFVKFRTRAQANAARRALDHRATLGSSTLHVKWGSGFGPKPLFDKTAGFIVADLDRDLTPADHRALVSSKAGGIRSGALRGGITIEEPDVLQSMREGPTPRREDRDYPVIGAAPRPWAQGTAVTTGGSPARGPMVGRDRWVRSPEAYPVQGRGME